MKKLLIFLFLFIAGWRASAQDTVRIMTFNIHFGADTALEALGAYIKQFNPDIVALQEVDIKTYRSGKPQTHGVNVLTELAGITELLPVFGKTINHPSGGYYGDAILSKFDILGTEVIALPYSDPKIEPREILIAHLVINGHDICFACTHLSHENKWNREIQLRRIAKIMKKRKESIKFLCGDLNSDTSEGLVAPIMKNWKDALPDEGTFASIKGSWYRIYRYDYILYSAPLGRVTVVDSFIECKEAYSDHCVCLTDIVLR